MKDIIEKIDNAKHIVVVAHENAGADSLGAASAMYTHLLRLHKKVSFFCENESIDPKMSCIPWIDKVRSSYPSSADLTIFLACENDLNLEISKEVISFNSAKMSTSQVMYKFFVENETSLNKKMATALYAGILQSTNGFLSDTVNGTIFAISKVLMDSGADFKLCNKYIMQYQSLASLRLKARMLSDMNLIKKAKVASFLLSCADMKRTGADIEDCEKALAEALFLPTVKFCILVKENEDGTIVGWIRSQDINKEMIFINETNTLESTLEEILKTLHKEL